MITINMVEKSRKVALDERTFDVENNILTLQIKVLDGVDPYDFTGKTVTAVIPTTDIETGVLDVTDGVVSLPVTRGLFKAGTNEMQLVFRSGVDTHERSPIMVWHVDEALLATGAPVEQTDLLGHLIAEVVAAQEAEAQHVANEAGRVAAEDERVLNESFRVSNEDARQVAESERHNAYVIAEGLRDESYGSAEAARDISYGEAESSREATFGTSQANRASTFNTSQAARTLDYEAAEDARDVLYQAAEDARNEQLNKVEAEVTSLEKADIRLAGQINNLVETTKPLIPDVKVSTYKPVTSLSPNAQEGQMNVKVLGLTLKNEVKNGDFRDGLTEWISSNSVLNVINGVAEFIAGAMWGEIRRPVDTRIGNKYYLATKLKTETSTDLVKLNFANVNTTFPIVATTAPTTNWQKISGVITVNSKINEQTSLTIKDYRTSGFDKIYIEYAMIIDMGKDSTNPLYNKTQAEMDEMVNNYFEGLTSVQAGTVKTTGKNLFDGKLESGEYSFGTGENLVAGAGYVRNANKYIGIIGGKTYAIWNSLGFTDIRFYFYDSSYKHISSAAVSDGKRTAPVNARYMNFRYYNINAKLTGNDIQLEEGTIATPYEPYQETTYSLPDVKLHSLPNGVRDYIEGNKLVKNVGEKELNGSEVWTVRHYGALHTAYYCTLAPRGTRLQSADNYMEVNGVPYTWRDMVNYDPTGIGQFCVNQTGVYISIDKTLNINTFLGTNNAKLLYQLAEPIITELPPMTLKSNPKGSVIYLNSKKVISTYTTKAETTVPIKTITKITKVLTDGTRIPISVNVGLTIAPDKLSFTHTSLVNGDNIEWEYDFDTSITTSPLIEYGYENSKGEFPCRNSVVNGDFSKGATGWIVESGITIIDGKMVFNNTNSSAKAEQTIIKLGDVYYSSFEISDYINGSVRIEHGVTSYSGYFIDNGKKSFVSKSLGNTSFNIRAMQSPTNLKVDNILTINLTETFGAGNEPTKEQMDKIMELHGGWFDGTVNPLINARDMYKLMVKNVDSGWITPTLLNGWESVSGHPVKYRKNSNGDLEIIGKAINATSNSAQIFVLPVGYRANRNLNVATIYGDTFGRLYIATNGSVEIYNAVINKRIDFDVVQVVLNN